MSPRSTCAMRQITAHFRKHEALARLAMNITPAHLDALQALGYTEVQARFLYLVATHSGYFTARQLLSFTGAHWRKRTTTFWSRLQSRGHARTDYFPKCAVVHRLYSPLL